MLFQENLAVFLMAPFAFSPSSGLSIPLLPDQSALLKIRCRLSGCHGAATRISPRLPRGLRAWPSCAPGSPFPICSFPVSPECRGAFVLPLRQPLELTRRHLEAGHASITPHLHHPCAVLKHGHEALVFWRLDLRQPFRLHHHVIAVVAGLAHAERFGRGEPAAELHPAVLGKPVFRGLLAFVAAAGPDPHFGPSITQRLHDLDHRLVGNVSMRGPKESAPILLEGWARAVACVVAFLVPAAMRAGRRHNERQAVLNQRQRAIKIEDVQRFHRFSTSKF